MYSTQYLPKCVCTKCVIISALINGGQSEVSAALYPIKKTNTPHLQTIPMRMSRWVLRLEPCLREEEGSRGFCPSPPFC